VGRIRLLGVVALLCVACVARASGADDLAAKWGVYWTLAGKSVGPSNQGNTISWTWLTHGKALRQVTTGPDGKQIAADRIYLDDNGTLKIFTREQSMFGTVYGGQAEPDGSLVFNNGGWGGFALQLEGEDLVYRAVKWRRAGPEIREETERFAAVRTRLLAGGEGSDGAGDDSAMGPADSALAGPAAESGSGPAASTRSTLPADGTAYLELGQEVQGELAHEVLSLHGAPVGAYRIRGTKGQRICVRVASDDAYVHATMSTSLRWSRNEEYTTFLPPWHEDIPADRRPARRAPATMLVRMTGRERILWVGGFSPSLRDHLGTTYQHFNYLHNEGGMARQGSFVLQVWDAELPEPVARDPRLAAARHPGASETPWLGDLKGILDQPWLNEANGLISQLSLEDGRLVQRLIDSATGKRLADRVYAPTGRRGEFRRTLDGHVLEVQCDGSWTLSDGKYVTHAWRQGDGIQWKYMPVATSAYMTAGYLVPSQMKRSAWVVPTNESIARVQANLAAERESARLAAEARAREQDERQAIFFGALGGFASGLNSAVQDQRRMEDGFRHARVQGMRDGMAARAAIDASELAARLASASSSSPSASRPAQGAGTGSSLPTGPAQATSPASPVAASSSAAAGEPPFHSACMIIQEVQEGRRGARLLLSSIGQMGAEAPDAFRLADNFRQDAGGRYGQVPSALCMRDRDRARLEQTIESSIRQHSGKEIVRTGIAPRL